VSRNVGFRPAMKASRATVSRSYCICAYVGTAFYFESALHVFPVASVCSELTFQAWNSLGTWKYAYGGLVDDIMFFAEDIFGDQFGISDDAVVLFEAKRAKWNRWQPPWSSGRPRCAG